MGFVSRICEMSGYEVPPARRHWEQTKPRRPCGYRSADKMIFAFDIFTIYGVRLVAPVVTKSRQIADGPHADTTIEETVKSFAPNSAILPVKDTDGLALIAYCNGVWIWAVPAAIPRAK